jgi:hypothetical protein
MAMKMLTVVFWVVTLHCPERQISEELSLLPSMLITSHTHPEDGGMCSSEAITTYKSMQCYNTEDHNSQIMQAIIANIYLFAYMLFSKQYYIIIIHG